MHKSHPLFIAPESTEKAIWRYMDFTKFVALLESQATFFCRSDLFEDPYEGTLPRQTLDALQIHFANATSPDGPPIDFSPKKFAEIGNRMKASTFISCWHMNDVESAAMWRVFLKSNEGIAIRSTYQRLSDALKPATQDVMLGKVEYVDFETTHVRTDNLFYAFTHKRKSYEHERELRALVTDFRYAAQDNTEVPPPGLMVDMDIKTLIHSVYIAPGAPGWFAKLVQDVIRRYQINCEVVQSVLNTRPHYY